MDVDLLTNIIDDNEANKIMDMFNEKVPGFSKKEPSLKQKKAYIKKIFKGQSSKTKRRRKSALDPLMHYLTNIRVPEIFSELSDEKLLFALNDKFRYSFTEHQKLAILYTSRPELADKLSLDLRKNYENGLPIFTGLFDLEESLISRYLHISIIKDKELPEEIKKKSELFLQPEEQTQLALILPKLTDASLKDLYNLIEIESTVDQRQLYLYAFLINGNIKSKLLQLDIAYELSLYWATRQKFLNSQLAEKATDNDKFIADVNKLTEKLDQTEKQLATSKKSLTTQRKTIQNYKTRINDLETEIIELKQEIKLIQEKSVANNQYWQEGINEKRKLNEKLQNENLQMKEQINSQQKFFSIFGEKPNKIEHRFAIVCSKSSDVIKMFFPEILFKSVDQWDYLNQLDYVETLYFQRNNLTQKQVRMILENCEKEGQSYSFFMAADDKELIEAVGYIKRTHGRLYP